MKAVYHRYMQNENGQFERRRVPEPPRPPSGEPEENRECFRAGASGAGSRSRNPQPPLQLPSLQNLLAGRDRGDLLVILILLLLLGEGNEESSTVVMTLAIFLLLQ